MKNKLPECHLIEILRKKSKARTDVDFDYVARLDEVRHRISGEVRFINELFPEYTPHDEEYHLSRLFHVADTIIEPARYQNMNVTELFVLACGLYGHDWGMAVSRAEKDYIISGVLPDGFAEADFALLHDEHRSFRKFVEERGLTFEQIKTEDISDDWREYVRKTHAFRSGTRMRHYFRNIDGGVGEAAGRVCEGHWLDIEILEDYRRYPINFAVLRESLNLAALAVYVRLVDLLDIASDRTPYVIWKFVAPRDRYSQMEWEKHRALQPVTCPPYLNGRVIVVDGSTDDHEVYAALEDLHNYCEKQVREGMNLLAQIGDARYFLDLFHIDWRVVARGFDPVLIRFEFDRDRVFDILSDEIYQGDPYVFLRELLQNSIDAIRMRRELLQREGIIAVNYGLIRVEVEHGSDGDARIACTDDGVGMDAYIVRNYLAVAGRSYYRSEEFEKQGLSLDPISRFGIGILSCFMVAELVEIETRRDPYTKGANEALRIKIPSVTRQFRIEKSAALDFQVGTRVIVHVEGRRLPEGTEVLDVTRYLKAIAGFIEFPIVVSENGKHVVILHPNSTINPDSDPRLRHYSNPEVHKLDFRYPFDHVFFTQDLENARAMFKEEAFDIQADLGVDTAEGVISYVVAKHFDWMENFSDYRAGGIGLRVGKPGHEVSVRWDQNWAGYGGHQPKFTRSADVALTYSVYRNGVLVPGAVFPNEPDRLRSGVFPQHRCTLNLLGTKAASTDIARVELKTRDEHWYASIHKALEIKLRQKFADSLEQLEPLEYLLKLGLFSLTYRTSESFVLQTDAFRLAAPMLGQKGNFYVTNWQALGDKPIFVCPYVLSAEVERLIEAKYRHSQYSGYLCNWVGPETLVVSLPFIQEVRIQRALQINRLILEEFYHLSEVIFVTPPIAESPPLVQEIWKPTVEKSRRSLESIAHQALVEPHLISSYDLAYLVQFVHYSSLKFVAFPTHERIPLRAGTLYNLNHPMNKVLVKAIAWLFLSKDNKADVNAGLLSDAVNAFVRSYSPVTATELTEVSQVLLERVIKVGIPVDSTINPHLSGDELWHTSSLDFTHRAQSGTEIFGEIIGN